MLITSPVQRKSAPLCHAIADSGTCGRMWGCGRHPRHFGGYGTKTIGGSVVSGAAGFPLVWRIPPQPTVIHALSVWTEGEPCGDSARWRGIAIGSGEVQCCAQHCIALHGRCQCAGTAGTAARGRRHGLAWPQGVNRSGELPATSSRLFTRSRARPDCRVQAWQHSCRCRCDWCRRFDAPGWRCRRRFA